MAKSKQKAVKTPKKRSTKYGKLAAVCSKELVAKKAALVRAEKAFAKAQKTHTELLAEVARLDMLDRSLKALINGTEVPQNVRYVYSYPQWVWFGNPYGWWWNGNTWTVNLGQTQVYPQYTYANLNGNFQGSQQFTTSNAFNTVGTTTADLTNLNCGTSTLTSSGATLNATTTGGLGYSNAGSLSLSSASSPSFTMTTTNGPNSSMVSQPELTVDLSTGATDDVEAEETELRDSSFLEVGI